MIWNRPPVFSSHQKSFTFYAVQVPHNQTKNRGVLHGEVGLTWFHTLKIIYRGFSWVSLGVT